jgi:nucleoside-diphosphate-sugar epimerase
MLETAAKDGVRSLVVRAGDFFGPHQPSSWFKDAMVKPGRPLRSVIYPGEPEAGHAWAYLPDLAETVARLAEIETSLPAFDSVHFGGYWLERGVELAKAVRRVSGNPVLPIRRLPWLLFYLGAPFVTFLREALEMRYLWRIPLRLDNAKLLSLIGPEPHTPLDEALRQTLSALGCLPTTPLAAKGSVAVPIRGT